ncbi:MAG: tRNA (N(6)-L-threonylcarbamoyladenosine(37)-C(2))-methylthiotransferase MtaB [Bacteroidales bacterium]|nr:tRNA (N(6)-L-threonylcarbamoyladenosine(37)-C(2))-methylthiotransferase MtaB [Bacteroidales bacterium]
MSEFMNNKKVAFYTLGCKLNFTETSTIAREFAKRGYKRVEIGEKADVYIINTCTVTQIADKKSRYLIRKITRVAPEALIAVVGCYTQLNASEVARIPGVDLILGNEEKFRIFDYINSTDHTKPVISTKDQDDTFHISYSVDDRTRSFLKVQDGCDYFCTYCTVPYARGRSRNISIEQAVDAANKIASGGIKEIVLTGINIGDFGRTTGDTFIDLIRALESLTDVERYRISSIEPNLLSNEIIEFVAGSKRFMPHFHMPLQSGCDKVLRLMQRKYDTSLFLDRVDLIQSRITNACIGVDIIAGFPGEEDKDFEKTYQLLEKANISYLHVFTYSDRERAKASKFPHKIEYKVKASRSNMLQELSEKKRNQFYTSHLGDDYKVLFESTVNNGMIEGFTENYIRVEHEFKKVLVGKVKRASLKEISRSGNVLVTL